MTSNNTDSRLRVWVAEITRDRQYLQASQPDISCAVFVSMRCVTTRFANEGIELSVCLFDVSASAALLRSVTGIDFYKGHASHAGLVGQEFSKLTKPPTMQFVPVSLFSSNPRSDALQFLYGNGAIRAFSDLDNAFRNYMVRIASKIGLSPTTFLQKTFSRFCSLAFQFSSQGVVSVSNLVKCSARIISSIAIKSDLDNSKINTKNINGSDFIFFGNVYGQAQKPLPVSENQITFSFRKLQKLSLPATTNKRKILNASTYGPNIDHRAIKFEADHSAIVSNASVFSELALNLYVALVGIGYFSVEPDYGLRRKLWKFTSNLTVKSPVHRKLSEFLRLPRKLAEPVCCRIGGFNGFSKRTGLGRAWKQFNLNTQYQLVLRIFKYLKESSVSFIYAEA